MKWPKSEEKPKLGVGGVVMATPSPQCTDPVPPNVRLVVQPLDTSDKLYLVTLFCALLLHPNCVLSAVILFFIIWYGSIQTERTSIESMKSVYS